MSKKQLKILAAAALTSAIVVPVAGFEASAATEVPTNGVYFHSADGTSKYIGAVEFASLSDAEFEALLTEFGPENIHAIYDGEYLSLAGAISGDEFKPYDNEIPNGEYTNVIEGEDGVIVDQTPSDQLTVESVSAITAKTLEVTFNKETDAAAADFSVKKGSVTTNVSNVVIAEDKKSATIELASKLTEGEYTVSVKVGEETITGSVTAENEKLAKIEILSDVAPVVVDDKGTPVTTDDEYSVKVGIQAQNQYGEDITKSAALTATASGAVVKTSTANINNNEVTVELKETVKKDDSFVLTIVDPTTGEIATKTIKVSDVATISTVEVGQLYNEDGKTLSQDSDTATDKFYLPVTLKDQYGKEVKLVTTGTDLVIAGVNTSIATVGTTFETISIDGKDTQVLPVTITNTALAGTTPVSFVVAATGSNAQASVTVAPGKTIANITLGAPTNEVVAQGEVINFPLTVVDTEGNEIKTLKELKALKAGRGFNAATLSDISEKDGLLVYSSGAAPANSLTVVVQTENGKVATKTVAVRETAKVATIGSINAKATAPLTTNFRSDDTTAKAFDKTKFIFQDQYGRTIASNSTLLTNVTVKATVADAAKSPFDLTVAGEIAIKSSSIGITTKSDTVTFTAFDADGNEIKGSGLDAKFIIADVSELVPGSFTVEPVETVYVTGGAVAGGSYSTDEPVVKGKAKSGETVTLKAGEYTVSATPTLDAEFFKDAEGKAIKEKTVDCIVTINQTGEEIVVPVTYSIATPEIQVVKAYDKLVATKEVTAVNVAAKTAFDLTALLTTATFKDTDQYGVETALDVSEVAKVTFSVTSGKATFSDNGTVDATVVTADENSVVKATITTTNGKTIAIAVTFTDGVVVATPPTPPVDTTPPAVSTITVNGTSLVITFDEALANTAVDATAFTVAGVAAGNSIASALVSGTTVTINLDNAAVSGDTVILSYSASGTTDLVDAAGNKVANIVSSAVTNNTP